MHATQQPTFTITADTFTDDVPTGTVVGSAATSGGPRGGVDVESRMSVDNGALRIRPLAVPGWGREGVSYGPYPRTPGLVCTVHVLNGHHASQTFYPPESRKETARRWLAQLRRFRTPIRPRHHENLSAGFTSQAVPHDPLRSGHAFVVHAATEDNGELWVGAAGRALPVARGVTNLPLALVTVLRERGAAYYVASLDGDRDFPGLPWVRPVGIDPAGDAPLVHAGVQQRILGEVGYRVDTRVYQVEVADAPHLRAWFGTAAVADRLTGDAPLAGSLAERGGTWRVWSGAPRRSSAGVTQSAADPLGVATVDAGEPAGLLHAMVRARRGGTAGLLWRADADTGTGWRVLVGRDGATLSVNEGTGWVPVATSRKTRLRRGRFHSLQVLDDGERIRVTMDAVTVFTVADDVRLAEATSCGVVVGGRGATLRDVEAHPRLVLAPAAPDPAWPAPPEQGSVTVIDERFDTAAPDLDGVRTPSGGRTWRRDEGTGVFAIEGGAARVVASVEAPNPGRTVYTVPWDDPGHVDVTLRSTPPGTARGQDHDGRCGVILWQDPSNYLIVNIWLDDWFPGASLSTFYRIDGHEDMYDAVWTLVNGPVTWGRPFDLRVVFDGERFVASIDGRPYLYRAIRDVYPDAPPLRVQRIGIIANEEWGDDTGTVLNRFLARGRTGR